MEAIQSEMTLRSFQHSMMIESFMMVFFLQHHTRTPVGPVALVLASTNRVPEKGRASCLSCLERPNLRSSTSCLVLLEPLVANGVGGQRRIEHEIWAGSPHGFAFLFELLDDYYPAPDAAFFVCDGEGRVVAGPTNTSGT